MLYSPRGPRNDREGKKDFIRDVNRSKRLLTNEGDVSVCYLPSLSQNPRLAKMKSCSRLLEGRDPRSTERHIYQSQNPRTIIKGEKENARSYPPSREPTRPYLSKKKIKRAPGENRSQGKSKKIIRGNGAESYPSRERGLYEASAIGTEGSGLPSPGGSVSILSGIRGSYPREGTSTPEGGRKVNLERRAIRGGGGNRSREQSSWAGLVTTVHLWRGTN